MVGLQRLRTPLLNRIMKGMSLPGEEEFYILLVPLVMWVCDARLDRLLGLLRALSFYTAGMSGWGFS